MDSAREFAEKFVPAAGYTAAERKAIIEHRETYVAARDADLWRMAQEQMREKAADHVPWSDGKCSCGIKYSAGSSMTPLEDWQNHIRSLPLDPLPNGDNHE